MAYTAAYGLHFLSWEATISLNVLTMGMRNPQAAHEHGFKVAPSILAGMFYMLKMYMFFFSLHMDVV